MTDFGFASATFASAILIAATRPEACLPLAGIPLETDPVGSEKVPSEIGSGEGRITLSAVLVLIATCGERFLPVFSWTGDP